MHLFCFLQLISFSYSFSVSFCRHSSCFESFSVLRLILNTKPCLYAVSRILPVAVSVFQDHSFNRRKKWYKERNRRKRKKKEVAWEGRSRNCRVFFFLKIFSHLLILWRAHSCVATWRAHLIGMRQSRHLNMSNDSYFWALFKKKICFSMPVVCCISMAQSMRFIPALSTSLQVLSTIQCIACVCCFFFSSLLSSSLFGETSLSPFIVTIRLQLFWRGITSYCECLSRFRRFCLHLLP